MKSNSIDMTNKIHKMSKKYDVYFTVHQVV
jgi:hypothetical protein